MAINLHLWSLLLKSWFRPVDKRLEAIAREAMQRAAYLGERIMRSEMTMLEADGLAHLFSEEMMRSIEFQFLWGVFHEFVQEYPDLPTNGFDRIKLHLISRLMDAHGQSFEAARHYANSVERLYNEADELFDAMADAGKNAYRDGRPGRLSAIVRALHETGMRAEAYRRPLSGAHARANEGTL